MYNNNLNSFKNKQLFDATRAFLIYALNKAREANRRKVNKTKIPLDFPNAFLYSLREAQKGLSVPPGIKYLRRNNEKLLQSTEFKKCQTNMEQDPKISRHIGVEFMGIHGVPKKIHVSDYIFHILNKLTPWSFLNYEFDESLFIEKYQDLESFFYNDSIPITYLVPLYGFSSKIEEINLDQGITIHKTKANEKPSLQNTYIFDDSVSNEKSEPRYVIESRSNKKKIVTKGKLIISNKSERKIEKIRESVAALRLFKKGAVGFPFILSTKTLDIPIPIEEQRINISDMPNLTSDKKYYHITNNEVSKFKQFWKEIERIKYNRHLKLAIERFNLAYQRVSLEDKIIDFTVSLEALINKEDDPKDSLTHKFSVRVSRLAKNGCSERKILYKKMNSLYTNRSNVVHGVKASKLGLNEKNIYDIEQIVRLTIRNYLDKIIRHGYSHDKIIDELDFN